MFICFDLVQILIQILIQLVIDSTRFYIDFDRIRGPIIDVRRKTTLLKLNKNVFIRNQAFKLMSLSFKKIRKPSGLMNLITL